MNAPRNPLVARARDTRPPRALVAIVAVLLGLAASGAAEDAAPRSAAELAAAADAAEAAGDNARAYALGSELARLVRSGDPWKAATAADIDAHRDRLAELLSFTLLEQGAAQEKDGQAVLAEKFYLQAVGYRTAAGDALERLYANPAAVQALGGADEVARHRTRLEADEDGTKGLRWHLRQLPRAATRDELDRQVVRLERLAALAGDVDSDVVIGTRLAARLGAGPLPTRDATSAARLAALSTRILPAGDAALAPVRAQEEIARHRGDLARFGERESSWTLRVGAWRAALSGRFSADAAPTTPTPGSAHQGASSTILSSSTGLRVDVEWLRQPAPLGPRSGPVWGGMLSFTEASFDADLVLADPDTSGTSLNGARFASRIGITGIGLDVVGGWRWAIGSEDSPWSLHARGYAGAHMLRFSYGTRRGAITGNSADETPSNVGVAPDIGAEIAAAWRFTPRWAGIATIGYEAMWLPSTTSSRAVTFVDQTGTPTGTGSYSEHFSGSHANGPIASLGIQASF